jgi:hypothetical protein
VSRIYLATSRAEKPDQKTVSWLRTVAAGHALVRNLRRGHDELTAEVPVDDRLRIVAARYVRSEWSICVSVDYE